MELKNKKLLEIHNLSLSFQRYGKGVKQESLEVISNLDFTVDAGEIVAVVGASGSGKSLLAAAILGILPQNAVVEGDIFYQGERLTTKLQKQLRGRDLALVPQSTTYLDPLMKVGEQVDGHRKPRPTEKRQTIFRKLALPENTGKLYPFQLSGGMTRRALVATAMISEAQLVIADEPTPGMSVEQALEALQMFRKMADEGKSVILITHDIDLAVLVADKVAVIYGGTTVEITAAKDFERGEERLHHPYTKALWRALPQNGFEPIPGIQPYAGSNIKGCIFAPRCSFKTKECEERIPPMRKMGEGEVRCHHAT